jgi:hypothetical protein
MTQSEWLACTDPIQMLEFLRGKASDRKLRLFAVACCRRIWHVISDIRSREAVAATELFADGRITESEYLAVFWPASRAVDDCKNVAAIHAATAACFSARLVFADEDHTRWQMGEALFNAQRAAKHAVWALHPDKHRAQQERHAQATLARCILGNPFRTAFIDPEWLKLKDGTVRKVVQTIYNDLAFDRLPALADALEEAGCNDVDILTHCRGEGPHVRGCWVIDLLLGKE